MKHHYLKAVISVKYQTTTFFCTGAIYEIIYTCKLIRNNVVGWGCFVTACGHNSSAEPIDLEQFKCSSSIQTVFEVLGETEKEEKKRCHMVCL